MHKELSENICQRRNGFDLKFCQSFFMRMTVISDLRNVTASVLKNEDFFNDILEYFLYQSVSIRIAKVEIFAQSKMYENDLPFDYFVVKLLVRPDYVNDTHLSRILDNIHRHIWSLNDANVFFLELEFYDEIIDSTGEVYIKSQSYRQTSWEKLKHSEFSAYPDVIYCRRKPVAQFHKTNVRPYIKLNLNEIPMTFIDGTLILNGQYLKMSLSQFEHKVQDDTVYICLEDVLLFYNAESGQTTPNGAVSGHSQLMVVILMVPVLFYHDSCLCRLSYAIQ